MFTLAGLRRRGVPIEALNDFLDHNPVTRNGNEVVIEMAKYNYLLKRYIDTNWSRCLAVINPVKLIITDLEDNHEKDLDVPLFPKDLE